MIIVYWEFGLKWKRFGSTTKSTTNSSSIYDEWSSEIDKLNEKDCVHCTVHKTPTNRSIDKKHLLHDLQLLFRLLGTYMHPKSSLYTLHSFHSILCQIISDFNFLHRWIFTITSGPFCLFLSFRVSLSLSRSPSCLPFIVASLLSSLLCKLIFQFGEKDVATT